MPISPPPACSTGRTDMPRRFAISKRAMRSFARSLSDAGHVFDVVSLRAYVDERIAACTPDFFASRAARRRSLRAVPFSVVGMPRSGTTLVEQILASHASVSGIGEGHRIGALVDALDPRWVMATGSRCVPAGLRDVSRQLDVLGDGAVRVSTKRPTSVHLGLIAVLFPRRPCHRVRARIRVTHVCPAIFKHSPIQCRTPTIWRHARNDCAKQAMTDHCGPRCPLPILIVQYEAIVSDSGSGEPPNDRVLGLEMDPACWNSTETGAP